MQNLAAMNEKAEALKKRTKRFALDVLAFVRTLPGTDEAKIIARQLIRSATGVGANYRATCRSRSKAEFVARIGVALEEADESAFWLEIITEGRIATSKPAFRLDSPPLKHIDELPFRRPHEGCCEWRTTPHRCQSFGISYSELRHTKWGDHGR